MRIKKCIGAFGKVVFRFVPRRGHAYALMGVALFAIGATVCGCKDQVGESAHHHHHDHEHLVEHGAISSQAPDTGDQFVADVGTLMQGRNAGHVFVFENTTDDTLTLPDDNIRKDCSCAAFEVAQSELGPGEATEVRMSVSLRSKDGRFREAVVTDWVKSDGTSVRKIFAVYGKITPAFSQDRFSIDIRKEDFAAGKCMTAFHIRPEVDLDLSTLTVSAGHESVTCDAENVDGAAKVNLTVDPEHIEEATFCSVTFALDTVATSVEPKLRVFGKVELSIEPVDKIRLITKRVRFQPVGDGSSGRVASLLVRGDLELFTPQVEDAFQVEMIRGGNAEATRVDYNLMKLARETYRIDVVAPKDLVAGESEYSLLVVMDGQMRQVVSVASNK